MREAERQHVVVGMDEVEALVLRTQSGWLGPQGAADCPDCVFDKALKQKDLTPAELKRELRDMLMIRNYFRDHVFSRVAVTDKEIENHLEKHPEKRLIPEQVHALQIVVKTEEEAKLIAREIRGGMSFEDAAMKYSRSPEGKSGGDLGFFTRGVMPAVFDDVCFNQGIGQVSGAVASNYGFHLFKVLEKRAESEHPIPQLREHHRGGAAPRQRKSRTVQEARSVAQQGEYRGLRGGSGPCSLGSYWLLGLCSPSSQRHRLWLESVSWSIGSRP